MRSTVQADDMLYKPVDLCLTISGAEDPVWYMQPCESCVRGCHMFRLKCLTAKRLSQKKQLSRRCIASHCQLACIVKSTANVDAPMKQKGETKR